MSIGLLIYYYKLIGESIPFLKFFQKNTSAYLRGGIKNEFLPYNSNLIYSAARATEFNKLQGLLPKKHKVVR